MKYTNLGVYVNRAMGLDIGNDFGAAFINDFFVEKRPTDIKSMDRWRRKFKFQSGDLLSGFKQFTITPSRHAILTSILEIMLLMKESGDNKEATNGSA